MRKVNKVAYLIPDKSGVDNYYTDLKVIGEYPLVKESIGGNGSYLSLVWRQEGILAKGNRPRGDENRQTIIPSPVPPLPLYRRVWTWLNVNGGAIQSVSIIGGVVFTIGWILFSANSRLGQLEEKINGEGGLVGLSKQVGEIDSRLSEIKGTLDAIDKYVIPRILPQILSDLKPKAVETLGTPDVGVFNVAYNEVTSDTAFSTWVDDPVSPQRKFHVTYSFKVEKHGHLATQSRIDEVESGKIVNTKSFPPHQMTLPSKVGERATYCIESVNFGRGIATPLVCIEIVLLEKVGQDNLIFASAVKERNAS